VDFIVPTGKLKGVETGDAPVIKGTAFVTGVGEDKAKAEIEAQLKA
jgi:PTS system galactitol-specific IIB component